MIDTKHAAAIMIFASSLLFPAVGYTQSWGGALQGLGRALEQSAEEWRRQENQKELERQRMELIMEQDRVRYERERQLIQQQEQAAEKLRRERAALERERAILEIERAHPGWQTTMATAQFASWFEAQPASLKNMKGRMTANDVILMLDLYKRDMGK